MAFAVFDFVESLARCWRNQASRSSTSGRDRWLRNDAALLGRDAVDLALDREQLVDPLHRLDGDRRLLQLRQFEEASAGVRPASGLGDRTRLASGLVQPAEAGEGVGLHDPGEAFKEALGMRAAAIGRVEEDRRRRTGSVEVRAAERPITRVHSRPSFVLPFRQHRHRRVVGMNAGGGADVRLDRRGQRCSEAATAPTQPASVGYVESMPSRAKQALCGSAAGASRICRTPPRPAGWVRRGRGQSDGTAPALR
jgi:hypothetical protein